MVRAVGNKPTLDIQGQRTLLRIMRIDFALHEEMIAASAPRHRAFGGRRS
jgi:hypothetical protein